MKRIVLMCVLLLMCAVSCDKAVEEAPKKPECEVIECDGFSLKIDRGANTVEILSPTEMAGVYAEFTDTGAYLISGDIRIPMSEKTAEGWKRWLG